MARITQFATPEPRPDEGGAPAAAGEIAGGIYKGVGSGLHDIGEALQRYGEMQETSQLHVGVSNAQTAANQKWEDLKQNGDITNPDTVQKFNEDYKNSLSSLTDNITSPGVRAHADELIASSNGIMQRMTLSDAASARREQATAYSQQFMNNQSAFAAANPGAYEELKDQNHIVARAVGLDQARIPEYELKLNQETARATVEGMALSGDLGLIRRAKQDMDEGRFHEDLDETQMKRLYTMVHTAETQTIEAEKAQRLVEHQQKEVAAEKGAFDYQEKLTDPNLNPKEWSDAILKDPLFQEFPEKARSLFEFGDRVINEPIRQKAQTEAQARAEAAAGRAETRFEESEHDRKIREAKADQGTLFNDTTKAISDGLYQSTDEIRALHLPLAQTNLLTRYFNSRQADKDKADGFNGQSKVFTDHYRGLITAPFGFPTVDGKASFYDAQQEVTQSEIAGRAKGLTAEQMFNPKSPDYIGGPYDRAVEAAKKAGIGGGLLDKDKTPIVISPHRAEVLKKYGLQ